MKTLNPQKMSAELASHFRNADIEAAMRIVLRIHEQFEGRAVWTDNAHRALKLELEQLSRSLGLHGVVEHNTKPFGHVLMLRTDASGPERLDRSTFMFDVNRRRLVLVKGGNAEDRVEP
jgi:hypothetical protein